LQNDPYELNNLAGVAEHQGTLEHLRARLVKWMHGTKDLGLVPEPELEVLARKYDSRYAILRDKENADLVDSILETIELGEQDKAVRKLIRAMKDNRPSVRWWAARKLGNLGWQAGDAVPVLRAALKDNSAGVRVECARALCEMEMQAEALPVLLRGLKNSDQVVRHYTALALEDIGEKSHLLIGALRAAEDDDYEYVKRLANRLVATLERHEHGGL
jgi:HEAT repeat protein